MQLPLALSLLASLAFGRPAPKTPNIAHPGSRAAAFRLANIKALTEAGIAAPVDNKAFVSLAADTASAAPYKNIWASLTTDEAVSVVQFLHNQTELNLTAVEDADAWSNYITIVDLMAPNKTDAMAYISGNTTEPPARYAYASISFNAFEEPYYEDIVVGPLPLSDKTAWWPKTFGTTKGTSKIRNYDADSDTAYTWYTELATEVEDIIEDLTGSNLSAFDIWGIDPLWHEDGRIVNWLQLWRIPETIMDSETLLPQGIAFKVDITGRDPSKWFLVGWLYNGEYYTSTAAFREAWSSGKMTKRTKNLDGEWTGTDLQGTPLEASAQPPPAQIQPGPQRFSVDENERYVQWMDFSFFITFTRDTGVRLYDIRYKNKTIVYELGLQEAVAHYAGSEPIQSGTAYLDTYYGFGPYAFELVSGVDCPNYAYYLNSTFHANELSTTHRNSICLFETDAGYPMSRHSSGHYVTATKNTVFTLRSVSTVGNYDYTFTTRFYLDGSIEQEVRASGYIQSAYFAQNSEYGYHIHDGLSGSMHEHVLNFRADVDILGTANTLIRDSVVPVQQDYVWSNYTRSTMKLSKNNCVEKETKLNWHAQPQGKDIWYIGNKDQPNKFGEYPGYRILPVSGGGIHLEIQQSSNLNRSMGFATHDFSLTRYKDSEKRAAHAYNDNDPFNPVVDFDKFFDGESTVQEDLVLWINLGMTHVPHTGDLPNTVMSTAVSSFMLTPHNYLYYDPSREAREIVRINYNSSNVSIVSDVMTFGAQPASGTFNLTSLDPNYFLYSGDSNVRKEPYDPTPYNDTSAIVR